MTNHLFHWETNISPPKTQSAPQSKTAPRISGRATVLIPPTLVSASIAIHNTYHTKHTCNHSSISISSASTSSPSTSFQFQIAHQRHSPNFPHNSSLALFIRMTSRSHLISFHMSQSTHPSLPHITLLPIPISTPACSTFHPAIFPPPGG